MTSFFDVTRLKGDLEARAAHTKAHAVHVDVVRQSTPGPTAIVVREVLNEGRGGGGVFVYCVCVCMCVCEGAKTSCGDKHISLLS